MMAYAFIHKSPEDGRDLNWNINSGYLWVTF